MRHVLKLKRHAGDWSGDVLLCGQDLDAIFKIRSNALELLMVVRDEGPGIPIYLDRSDVQSRWRCDVHAGTFTKCTERWINKHVPWYVEIVCVSVMITKSGPRESVGW